MTHNQNTSNATKQSHNNSCVEDALIENLKQQTKKCSILTHEMTTPKTMMQKYHKMITPKAMTQAYHQMAPNSYNYKKDELPKQHNKTTTKLYDELPKKHKK